MKTTISKQSIFRKSILFFSVSAFILSALLFTSCSESDGIDNLAVEDSILIEKIEKASKVSVEASALPSATAASFSADLADSFVEKAQLATGLGYKVSIATDNLSREEAKSDVFFSVDGKQLTDNREKSKRKRNKCFEFVFPIDFIMPDDSSITLNSKDDWSLIKDWYTANADVKERPEFVFPVNITLKEDGSTQTLIDIDELKAVKDACRKGRNKRKCFKLVLPVSFTMPDASVIDVTERKEFKLLREWHKANPDATEKGALNYPVDIMYKDDTTATINNEDEMKAAKTACKD